MLSTACPNGVRMKSLKSLLNFLTILSWFSASGIGIWGLLKWIAIAVAVSIALLLLLVVIGSFLPDEEEQHLKGVDDRVARRLINLCYGDTKMAWRLACAAQRPGRSQQWAWEKAAEDLLRDRS